MKLSRRDCSLLLLPALLAKAQTGPTALPSKVYKFEDLPVRTREKTASRAVLNGPTNDGFLIESHQTQLAAGAEPHAPHRHVHAEIFMVREGTLEVFIAGNRTTIGPGGMAYVASNDEHGVRNVGATPAHYFIVTLGLQRA